MKKIVFAAGGTGGHVSPAIALAEAWHQREPDSELFILGGDRVEESDFTFPGTRLDIEPPQQPMHPKCWLALIKSYVKAHQVLTLNQIDGVIATGGYACFPTLLAARRLAIPFWLLDANHRMGRVVKLFGKKAVQVIGPTDCDERGQTPLGNPVRSRFEECSTWSYQDSEPLHILVSGGSGGAQTLDQRLPEVLNKIHETTPLKVTHITRRDSETPPEYKMKASVRPPGPDFFDLLNECHVLIGRAGGSTIAECNAAGRPQVLVPLPTAKDNHQRANARSQVKNKAAIMLDQSLSNEVWYESLELFLKPQHLKLIAANAYNSYPRELPFKIVDVMRDYIEQNKRPRR